ncbi:GNAT family N-acetyltransferase [Sabulicella glaciei]|uniref:GNAT family N-acetyltransferase n=1 Tax=Sabulicella glaciei TaxID=2984948 RepID=A0ABT3P3C4_9PROT|nr:GNAT family N-acetyltransferase [Roseococcus sp. MDT2-1-1]MCW8088284.1 GNAT family N-acetyltransferase [Roseococcus sp. MDT2-1-1]
MLREYRDEDAARLNQVALAAFRQFHEAYDDWPAMAASIGRMSVLSQTSEIIVAEDHGEIVGGVAYVPAGAAKAAYFDPHWPIIRMLVVDPQARGRGLGRLLTEECIARARRDRSPVIALHTTPVMSIALRMYLRMGFERFRDALSIYGVPYGVYILRLA